MKYLAASGVIVILAFITFSFFQYEEEYEWEKKYDYQLNEKVYPINSVIPYNQSAKNYLTTGKEKPNTLIIFFECYCATCANNLLAWERFATNKKINKKLNVLLIINQEIHSYIKNVIKNKKGISFPVYLDTSNSFFKKDKNIFMGKDNSILLNRDSRIQFIGSPLIHKSHRRKLLEIINSKL